MDAADLAVPARALDEAAAVIDPFTLAALRAGCPAHAAITLSRCPHGSLVAFVDARGDRRRLLEIDRAGTLLTVLRWRDDALAEAAVRIPDGRWITVEPRATVEEPFGPCDRLWLAPGPGRHGAAPLVEFAAVDYADVDGIPALADPTRLPPGAGTTVLNLLASLARDRDRRRLRYRGPYPTEQLFLALLESFHYETHVDSPRDAPRPAARRASLGPHPQGEIADPLAAFVTGDLAWNPAPYERRAEGDGIVVQLRGRVEKVMWHGRTYYRPDWQAVTRHAPRRVRDVEGGVVCSLWALGAPLEDHLRLAPDGALLELVAPNVDVGARRPLPGDVTRGVVASVAATSVPALARFVRDAGRAIEIAWGPVDRDLLAIDGAQARLSERLRAAAVARLHDVPDRAARVTLAFALLGEIAALLGDALRLRAQALLAERPAAEQRAALRVIEDPDAGAAAALIGRAVEALLAELQS